MKEYETLTREKVDVVPFGCGMPETHLMQDWSDRMLDLILNGPTINGIKKDEVRAMLRETYTALKQYEKIGPMASPFINDPTAIVARAFSELYPGVEYVAQYVPDLRDETNGTAYGLTIFPDDGSTPIVCISAEAPISAAPELLAHELAHVATPEDTDEIEEDKLRRLLRRINSYKESNIRKWLNSSFKPGDWWSRTVNTEAHPHEEGAPEK